MHQAFPTPFLHHLVESRGQVFALLRFRISKIFFKAFIDRLSKLYAVL